MNAPANPPAMRIKKYRFRRTTAQNAIASHRKTHLRASFAAALQRQSTIAMAGNRRNNNCRVSLRQMDDHPLRGDPRCARRLVQALLQGVQSSYTPGKCCRQNHQALGNNQWKQRSYRDQLLPSCWRGRKDESTSRRVCCWKRFATNANLQLHARM